MTVTISLTDKTTKRENYNFNFKKLALDML